MGLLLDIVYAAGLVATSPAWLYRMIRHGRYRSGIDERFGSAPIRYGLQPIIWVHGVSLGEINAARSLVDEIHRQLPDYRVVVSSTTDTGMAAAKRLFAPSHLVFHWPLDFSLSVRRALSRLRPDMVVLMEGEAWPNFLAACNRRGIPAVVVNARISPDKGFPRYRRLGPLARRLFNRLAAIGCQDESYRDMFRQLGVDDGRLHVTGMMKFDSAPAADTVDGQDALAAALDIGPDDKLVVAGGTGTGEEKLLLDIWPHVLKACPDARLAIVPRKPERFDEVAALIRDRGQACIRRSERSDDATGDVDRAAIILGDTMGELRKFYALASCVFVGRSLVPMGGSDMIEAAALGKPVAFGPHTFNFPQADALARHGAVRVADADALAKQLAEWLTDAPAATLAADAARAYIRSQQGATVRNVEMICEVLGKKPAAAPGCIATWRPDDEVEPSNTPAAAPKRANDA
jgi:3-deoxy-D-manno-octulosonic-acid transferase